jgi:hypothetical protein
MIFIKTKMAAPSKFCQKFNEMSCQHQSDVIMCHIINFFKKIKTIKKLYIYLKKKNKDKNKNKIATPICTTYRYSISTSKAKFQMKPNTGMTFDDVAGS